MSVPTDKAIVVRFGDGTKSRWTGMGVILSNTVKVGEQVTVRMDSERLYDADDIPFPLALALPGSSELAVLRHFIDSLESSEDCDLYHDEDEALACMDKNQARLDAAVERSDSIEVSGRLVNLEHCPDDTKFQLRASVKIDHPQFADSRPFYFHGVKEGGKFYLFFRGWEEVQVLVND